MTGRRSDWLDRLALRSLAKPVLDAHMHESAVGDEGQFSRTAAVKLALAGAAALSLGLGTAPAARAQDRGECFIGCVNDHDTELKRRLRACIDVFEPREIQRSDPFTWGRYRRFFSFGGERDLVLAGTALVQLCELQAEHAVRSAKKECYEGCERTCRRRSVQSRSARSAATCEVTPPPHAPPPTIPPIPPNPAADLCAGCAGVCCDCGSGPLVQGRTCANYVPSPPCDMCKRNCTGTC